MFELGLPVCTVTAAGHDSPAAVAEWVVGCSPGTLAVLGGRPDPWTWRIRPPGARTLSRFLEKIDAEAFNRALYGYRVHPRPLGTQGDRVRHHLPAPRPGPLDLLADRASDQADRHQILVECSARLFFSG